MSRITWFAAGVASGVYGIVKVRRTLESFTPDGIAARFAAWQLGARMIADEVSAGMARREAELRDEIRASDAAHRAIAQQATKSPALDKASRPRAAVEA